MLLNNDGEGRSELPGWGAGGNTAALLCPPALELEGQWQA